jgi:hypothetical protein
MSEKTYIGETHTEELSDTVLDQVAAGNTDIINLVNTIAAGVERVNHMALELR